MHTQIYYSDSNESDFLKDHKLQTMLVMMCKEANINTVILRRGELAASLIYLLGK